MHCATGQGAPASSTLGMRDTALLQAGSSAYGNGQRQIIRGVFRKDQRTAYFSLYGCLYSPAAIHRQSRVYITPANERRR